MVCFWCTLFVLEGTHISEDNRTKIGINNWKKGSKKIKGYENTDIRKTAAFQYSCFIAASDIEHSLKVQNWPKRKEENKLKRTEKVISTLFNITNLPSFRRQFGFVSQREREVLSMHIVFMSQSWRVDVC